MVTGCLRAMKVAIFALGDKKVALVSYEKYGTLSMNDPLMSLQALFLLNQ